METVEDQGIQNTFNVFRQRLDSPSVSATITQAQDHMAMMLGSFVMVTALMVR